MENKSMDFNLSADDLEMIKGFYEESFPMVETIEGLILKLEENSSNTDIQNTYFRLLHTIKGTSACVGLKNLASFCHAYEDFFSNVKNGQLKADRIVINRLLKGLDYLKLYFNQIEKSNNDTIDSTIDKNLFDLENIKKEQSLVTENKIQDSTPGNVLALKSEGSDDKMLVPMDKLDQFMEMSGELTVVRNTLMKVAATLESRYVGDLELEALSETLRDMHKITSNMQNQISDIRKIDVKNIYRPFKRVVRDLSKKLNKEIELETLGEEKSVDNILAKLLSNSLIHLIRNSIDHGLEIPSERLKNAKNKVGKLYIHLMEEGENIVVNIGDDGRGIDPEMIKKKAIEKGLYTDKEISKFNKGKILSIIFEPGFSTAAEVSDLSGRGVGMDMVRSSVEAINGKILIESEIGKGTNFKLTLPIPKSVLILNSLLVCSNNHFYLIPMDNIAEIVMLNEETGKRIKGIEGAYALEHYGRHIPLLDFSSIVKQENFGIQNKDMVVVKTHDTEFALAFDQIFDFEEVVLKSIMDTVKSNGIYSGASLFGNGSIALVLDIEKISKNYSINKFIIEEDVVAETKREESFLLFKLWDQSTYAAPLSTVNRLEEFKLENIEFSLDQPLVRYGQESLPLINLAQALGLNTKAKIEDKIQVIVVKSLNSTYGFIVNQVEDIISTTEMVDDSLVERPGFLGTLYAKQKTISVINFLDGIQCHKQATLSTSDEFEDFIELKKAA